VALRLFKNLETRLVGGQGDQPEDVSTCKRSFGEREHHGGCGLLATRDQAAAFSLLADGLKLLDSSSWVGEPPWAAGPKLHPQPLGGLDGPRSLCDHYGRANTDAPVKVDNVLIVHADATV
jgi:hypothetical protein